MKTIILIGLLAALALIQVYRSVSESCKTRRLYTNMKRRQKLEATFFMGTGIRRKS